VAAALKTGEPIATAIGHITYGATGDMTSQSFSLYKWQGGKIVPAE
jgi:branched-chain amino acid transport system substrate-binding protein